MPELAVPERIWDVQAERGEGSVRDPDRRSVGFVDIRGRFTGV